jgi:surfeit locus 1 family protein
MVRIFFQGRRLFMTILILIGACLLSGLGVWQWGRHIQRADLNAHIIDRMAQPPLPLPSAAIDPEQFDYRRVELHGRFDVAQSVLLRNRSFQGTTGYHLITPFLLDDGQAILVDRGWVPLTNAEPASYAASGATTIRGVARRSQHGLSGPLDPPFSADRPRLSAWFRVDIERIQEQAGYPLLPIFVELQPDAQLPSAPPFPALTTDLGLGSHLGYAFQWFSFAVILVVGYIALTLRPHIRGRS